MPFTSLRETPRELEPTAAEQVAAKRVREYEVRLDAMEKSVLTLKNIILELEKVQSEKERALQELQTSIASLEGHIDVLAANREKSLLRLKELRGEISQQENFLDQLHSDVDKANAAVRVSREQLAAVEVDAKFVIEKEQEAVRDAQHAVALAEAKVLTLTQEIEALRVRLEEGKILEARIPVLQEQITTTEKQLERVQAILEVTRYERQKIDDEKVGAISELEAVRKTLHEEMVVHTQRMEHETAALIERERLVGLRENAWTAREERLSAKIDELKLKFPAEMAKLAL